MRNRTVEFAVLLGLVLPGALSMLIAYAHGRDNLLSSAEALRPYFSGALVAVPVLMLAMTKMNLGRWFAKYFYAVFVFFFSFYSSFFFFFYIVSWSK